MPGSSVVTAGWGGRWGSIHLPLEHVEDDPYANYFTDDGTFHGVTVDDDRLPPREPTYACWLDSTPMAVALATVEGGHVELVGERTIALWRAPGASVFASTDVALVARADGADRNAREILDAVEAGTIARHAPLQGFDTYWYTWVNVNRESGLVD